MPKTGEIPDSTRSEAIGLYKGGSGVAKISKILKINCSTLHYIIRKWKRRGSTSNLKRAGRPMLMTERGRRQLKSIVKSNRRSSLRNLTNQYNDGKVCQLSQKTISRNLHRLGFYARRPCKKPWISKANQRKRLEVFIRHKFWGLSNWKRIIFSDESKFNLISSDGRIKLWRNVKERYLPESTNKTIKGGGGSIMFWGCIAYGKIGPLIEVSTSMNSNDYINNILERFLPFWKVFRRKHRKFMQTMLLVTNRKIQ